MADKPKLQNLPESQYPRSYSPRMQAYVRDSAVLAERNKSGKAYNTLADYKGRDYETSSGEELIKSSYDQNKKRPAGTMPIDSYKRGGRVRRTGLAKVHRGERVLTRKQAQSYRKSSGGLRKRH